jgi:predicted ATPase
VEAELLYQRGLPPQATYLFKHALIQDTAYQSLLRSTRQQYHQHIAQVLEARFPDLCETQPELLAQHYTEAGLMAQAVLYWQRAGQRAVQRSAHVEAVAHLTRGLALLTMLPDTPERARQELALQLALADALAATRGYAAPAVGEACARARELCQQVGETAQRFRLLARLWSFHLVRAELQTAHEFAQQCLTLSQQMGDPTALLSAHQGLGQVLLHLGALVSARSHLEQVLALYNPQQHRQQVAARQEPGMIGLSYTARVLWLLGFPDQALQRSDAALSLARDVGMPGNLAYALLAYAAMLHEFRREERLAQEYTEVGMALAAEQGLAQLLAMGTIRRGRALAARGSGDDGLAQMHQGLAAYRATGAEVRRPYFLALLAETYGKTGQPSQGLSVLTEALTMVDKTAEGWWAAELHRLKGELLLRQASPTEEVEGCFRQALEIARPQQAKSLELRAAMSLSRLWQQQGKRAAAHELLAPIYGWFTEGFDTADLQEAKALLEELSRSNATNGTV